MDGTITEAAKQVRVGSNTSIIGKDSKAILSGFGLYVSHSYHRFEAKLIPCSLVKGETNVIIRNLGVQKVLAENGDAIGVREYIVLKG